MTKFLHQILAIFLLNLLSFSPSYSHQINGPEFCDQTAECVAKVRRMTQESNRFWFGDQWRFNCGQQQRERQRSRQQHQNGVNPLDCLNPHELAPFASLGSRLFRVHTFTPAYLANLRIFPRIHFQPRTGFYRACSHNFEVNVTEEERLFGLPGHPQGRPIPAFQAQQAPDLNWPELHANQSWVVLMLDPGWGRLAYLAVDFPRDTKILADFQPVDNFRPQQPTPLAVLIFELPRAEAKAILEGMEAKWTRPRGKRRDQFELGQFMLENRLEKGLIGLNWALIRADPFAIEKQRLQGMPDNCHALVVQKLLLDQRWHFVQTFPLASELDSSLAISLAQPESLVQACCHSLAIPQQQQLFLDPLADLQIPTIAFRHRPPTITSMRPMENAGEPAYQRASRHYIVYNDEHFTLALFDPDRQYLHWLLVDIPADGIVAGNFQEAIPVADYLAPVPSKPGQCLFAIFMLFRQPRADPLAEFFNRDHPLRQAQCQGRHCPHRTDFNVEQFKALHRLHLSAINWAKICFDLFEASYQISLLRKRPDLREGVDRTAKIGDEKRSKKGANGGSGKWDRAEREREIGAICAHFPLNKTDERKEEEEEGGNGEEKQRECIAMAMSSSAWMGGGGGTFAVTTLAIFAVAFCSAFHLGGIVRRGWI